MKDWGISQLEFLERAEREISYGFMASTVNRLGEDPMFPKRDRAIKNTAYAIGVFFNKLIGKS